MFAIIAAVLFGLALIFELASVSGNTVINPSTLEVAGFLCLALHLAGAASWRLGTRRRRRR